MSTLGFVPPMKAVLHDQPFSDPDWIFERKLDGIRCEAIKSGGAVRLLSRNELSLNSRFPEVASALESDPADDFIVDGEVVAFAGSNTSFAKLARRGHERVAVFLYVFDVMHLDGRDTRPLPLRERKRLLRGALELGDPIRLAPHRNGDGEALFEEACQKGWEGLIAKRADSPYVHGRSRDWLKFKCGFEQELVIGGFTPPRGSRTVFGALLVGYYDRGKLRYAGKVGTGFTHATLKDLGGRLAKLRVDEPPFDEQVRERNVAWVRPELVAQVGFSEWTRAARLRHPRFLGLRDDKAAGEVVRE